MSKTRRLLDSLASLFGSWGLALTPAKEETPQPFHIDIVVQKGSDKVFVGTLSQERGEFIFKYAPDFRRQSEIPPIPAFPDVSAEYRSKHLFPFFQVRLPALGRPDVDRLLEERQIDQSDTLRLLGELGKRAISGPYEFELHEATVLAHA